MIQIPWWIDFKHAVMACSGELSEPEIQLQMLDICVALGFLHLVFLQSNTQILLHDHNELLKDTAYLERIEVHASIIKSLTNFKRREHLNTHSRLNYGGPLSW